MLRNSAVRLWKLIARCFFWMAGFRFLAARLDRALVGESTPSAALKREPHTAWQVSTSMRGSELPQRPKPKKCHQTIAQVADVAPEAGADAVREAAHAVVPPPYGRNVLQRSKRKPSGNKSSAFSPEKAEPPPATGTPAQTRRPPAGREGIVPSGQNAQNARIAPQERNVRSAPSARPASRNPSRSPRRVST